MRGVRFVQVINSLVGVGLVLFYLEMARFIASDPVNHHMAAVDWPVPLALAMASSVLAFLFIRELVRDIRGYWP
jgi:predicted Co/Zn/Cd cation transporter (cation efflux family)